MTISASLFTSCILLLVFVAIVASLSSKSHGRLIVGLNKYSHDASCCIIDINTGSIVFSQAKERYSGKKHDGGAVGVLLSDGLNYIGASIEDIHTVVSNNHHFRVLPFERRINLYDGLKYIPSDYKDRYNLISNAKHMELSHHLAHAWSVVGTAPFKSGLVVVMDGMGESYKAMIEDMNGLEPSADEYMHDLKLLKSLEPSKTDKFVGIPTSLSPGSTYREAETAYVFDSKGEIIPVYKRWSRERTPSELYNHGFENMESMGAVYSRLSSHILGDWNACGKVMGLAPWSNKKRADMDGFVFNKLKAKISIGDKFHHDAKYMTGNPYIKDDFKIDWNVLDQLECSGSGWDDKRFSEYATMANSIQGNLEASALSLITSLKAQTGSDNVGIVGGVGLNSVLNGKIRQLGFENVYVPPCPGDEGIAVGCALYGLHQYRLNEQKQDEVQMVDAKKQQQQQEQQQQEHRPFSPYTGRLYSEVQVVDALHEYSYWINYRQCSGHDQLTERAADRMMTSQKPIAWFQGRSEFGQRALGSRSLLADPRNADMRVYMNEVVKKREWYRPLAPSVLDEHVSEWFDGLDSSANASPYMQITTDVKVDKRGIVPAICHVDGSARLQTVSSLDNKLYHALISRFHSKTGVPMILNTSFNRKSQPIVEAPSDAIKTFMSCKGSVDALYLHNWEVSLKPFPFSLDNSMHTDDEAAIAVQAVDIYLTEVVSSTKSTQPVRARIQDGTGAGGDDDWKTLPDQLHLELLLLLQACDPSGNDDSDDGSEDGEDQAITIGEIYDSINQIYSAANTDDADVDSNTVTWFEVRGALQWLYSENLIWFDDPNELIDDIEGFFPGAAQILDMRESL